MRSWPPQKPSSPPVASETDSFTHHRTTKGYRGSLKKGLSLRDLIYTLFVVRPPHASSAPSRENAGFTIVELMAVIVIVGLLAAAAVVFVTPRSFASTARGYTFEISALCDSARQRASASRTYQRLEIDADEVIHYQATTSGMAEPTEWEFVARVPVPSQVSIASFDERTHIFEDDDVPAVGEGLPGVIEFAPDGSATPATIFVTDSADEKRARVAVYRATGSAYTYYEW